MRPSARSSPSRTFSATENVLDEQEVLVHHADPGVQRLARRAEAHWLSVQLDLALVRTIEARQDVRERRLACAVLAEQRMHLAGGRLEVDAIVRERRRGSAS